MKTRFSPLISIKKDEMQKKERVMQRANADLNSASIALEMSYNAIHDIKSPTKGFVAGFLASRSLLDSSRYLINHNKEWVSFAEKQVSTAKEALKLSMIEYEKFKYLELEEIKKIIKLQQEKESKDLDEVALMVHQRRKRNEADLL